MRTVLATFLDRPSPDYTAFFNALSAALRARGVGLVMLAQTPQKDYAFPTLPLAYAGAFRPLGARAGLTRPELDDLLHHERHGGKTAADPCSEGRLTGLERYLSACIRAINPALVLNWCGLDTLGHLLEFVARREGLAHAVLERGFFARTLCLEPEGIFGLSRALDPGPVLDAPEAYLRNIRTAYLCDFADKWPQGRRMASAADLRALCGMEGGGRLVFFAGSNDHSSGAYDRLRRERTFSALYESSYHAARDLAGQLAAEGGHLLFKPHPRDHTSEAGRALLDPLPNVTITSDLNVFDAMEHADAVAVVTSTVMIDALLMNKPLIVLGNTWFDRFALPGKVRSAAELGQTLAGLRADPVASARAVRHACQDYLFGVNVDWIAKGPEELAGELDALAGPDLSSQSGAWDRLRLKLLFRALTFGG